MKQQILQTSKIFSLFKHAFITCKTQHFLFLRHANTYWHTIKLLQVLFCHLYIFYPHKLFSLKKSLTLPKIIAKKRTRFASMLHKIAVGACFGFLFWLPFWWFIFATLLSPLLYGIFCAIFACFIIYLCVIFISFKAEEEENKIVLSRMSLNFNKRYFSNTLLSYFIIFTMLCIAIFSFLHKNSYIGVSLCYPISITIFLFMPRIYRFWFGFFIGVFGFYWMTLSFRFEGLDVMIPLAIICVGLIYGILLWFLCYFQNLAFRFVAILLLFFIHPLNFNWLNIVYFSSYSVFEASFLSLLCVEFACYFIVINSALRLLAPMLLLIAFDYDMQMQTPKLHAKIIETKYPQDMKWLPENRENIIENNLKSIETAIKEGYVIVILPETAFPFVLNADLELYETLLNLSHKITIVVGAMRFNDSEMESEKQNIHEFIIDALPQLENMKTPEDTYINTPNTKIGYYNTTYIFAKGSSLIADKNVLVPFGETLPFNDFIAPVFKDIFGENFGFNKGNGVVSFVLKGYHIAIANCYEGTMNLPYKTNAKYIFMLSNNAWFNPSTQRFMQQMIVKYYARNNKVFVYHSTNYTPKAIITPNNGRD